MTLLRQVHALRGATTVEADQRDQITEAVVELMTALLERNGLRDSDCISVLFTATDDLTSMFPATAARTIGFDQTALLCARELSVDDATPRCLRVLVTVRSRRPKQKLEDVFLRGAANLRDVAPR